MEMETVLAQVKEDYPELTFVVQGSLVGSCYLPSEMTIIIEPHVQWETLLHEVSHHVNKIEKKDVHDELAAWQTAMRLAQSYGLTWTKDQDDEMLRCLATYGISLKDGKFVGSEKAVARYASSLAPNPLWKKLVAWTLVGSWVILSVGAVGYLVVQEGKPSETTTTEQQL